MTITIQQLQSMVFMVPGRGGVQLFMNNAGELMARDTAGSEFGPVLMTALPGAVDYLELPMVGSGDVPVPDDGKVRVFVGLDGVARARLHDGSVVDTLRGPKGDKGDKGDTGEKGNAGAVGAASTVPGPTGPRGQRGPAPNITIGDVFTGAPGSDVEVTVTGASPDYVLNFTIPQGAQGPQGAPGSGGASAPVKVAEWSQWTNSAEYDCFSTPIVPTIANSKEITAIASEFMILRCTSADKGYSAGAVVRLHQGVDSAGGPLWTHFRGGANQSHIYVLGEAAPMVYDLNATAWDIITPASWAVEVWAVL